jgi:hypothetical protein
MDEEFARRSSQLRRAWGELGPGTKIPTWARQLRAGIDVESAEGKRFVQALRNLERGHRPNGGEEQLRELYGPLDPSGLLVNRIAAWAWFGYGEMPRPARGAYAPNVSAPIEPAQPAVRGGAAAQLLEDGAQRALEALYRGEDATPILEGVLRLVRDARQLGLATVITFAMIGAASKAKPAQDAAGPSGGIGRRARFRVFRPARAKSKPRRKSINLDDLAARGVQPKSRERAVA